MESEHRYGIMDLKTGLFVASLSDEAFATLTTHWSPPSHPETSSGQYVLRIEELPPHRHSDGNKTIAVGAIDVR